MIAGIKGRQSSGKTIAMVAKLWQLVYQFRWYAGDECMGNVWVDMPGYKFMYNDEVKFTLKKICKGQMLHRVLLVDEIDGLFSHREWSKPEQIELLNGLWQDYKLWLFMMYTAHIGKSVDKIIRQVTKVLCVPEYDRPKDMVHLTVFNGEVLQVYQEDIYPASFLHDKYDRWQVVI